MQLAADFILIIVQSLALQNLFGLSSAAVSVKNGKGLFRLGILTMLFSVIVCGLTAAVRPLIPTFWQKLLFPLVIILLCGILDLLLVLAARLSAFLNRFLMPQLHYAAFSSAVLGAVLMSTEYTHDIGVAFRYGFRAGFGYLAACLMLKAAAPLLYSDKMPQAVRGRKGLLLYAALLSMAAACLFPKT